MGRLKLKPVPRLGGTGNYPDGKINKNDEGEIRFGVANVDGKVILNFGKPVAWVGMNPDDARRLADMLIKKANELHQ